ncbi:2-hydroxyacid dehydrogenase [Sphingobium yanoikuyae]|jgi:lactate dehydrogenase-like 2-hydroxyacid dehydrogenase|uniref:2-hydroxyacid dehydrogenase n=1 Tax=Sphingobium yanoikuyae TaxID=13690 RepID=A0A085K572_SPHYA|nr:2-hydroxyacid dehydrogenase [Sphingobium yanoikuyae]AYO79347.1 2-hydroxyacid dehydrogenase [Sphingobium yanoikuyae]KFD27868.1 2-hydroxyacid dehydrogenase [Sphingobium yanoikuyae]KZC79533.1 hydroxyacid dehydrogenase [Sphingobium yanoikuyae]MDV3481298.1 2-hydroxyacid dehydrogenase [Sphingobium yanoikuyae]
MAHLRPVILIAQPHLAPLLPILAMQYDVMGLWEEAGRARLAEAEILVTAGEFRLDPAMLAAMTRLRLIACFTVGYDGVDLDWARANDIAVSHAGDANAEDVADHAIGLILAHRRQIVSGDRALRAGEWLPGGKTITRSIAGARLGIVGMGSIGISVAARADVLRMTPRWWGPRDKPSLAWPRGESLEALAAESDILVVAARATDDNRGMISAAILDALGPDGLLVNVARGQLVDEDALIDALRAGRLGGAALDVYAQEPTDPARWADVPNCILTPHTGGATDAAVAQMAQMLLANIRAFVAEEPLPNRVL